MKYENYVENKLMEYLKKGSDKKTLLEIRQKTIDLLKNGREDFTRTTLPIIDELMHFTSSFSNSKNLVGVDMLKALASSIYIGGEKSLKVYINDKESKEKEVDEKTYFDVASITKLYTLLLQDKLIEEGYFTKELQIKDVLTELGFSNNLGDFTFEDIALMVGELRTNGNVAAATSISEALDIIKTTYVFSSDKTVNKYSDIPAIIAAIAMTSIYNKYNHTNLKYEQILYNMILKPNKLYDTMYNPKCDVVGNGLNSNLVHDPKTRAMGGVSGAAGIFTTSCDLIKLAEALFNGSIVSKDTLEKYSSIPFANSPQSNKGYYGLYVKNSEHAKSFCPRDYSNKTFASQGYTGSLAIFDVENKFHNAILVDALQLELEKSLKDNPNLKDYITGSKANGFIEATHSYHDVLTRNTLILGIIKKYFEDIDNYSNTTVKVKVKRGDIRYVETI